MDIISPSVSPKIINNTIVTAAAVGATLVNGTGTATGSPITLVTGANTIPITGAGNFTITLPANCIGEAISATATVTGGPVELIPGANIIDVGAAGLPGVIIVNVIVINPAVSIPGIQTGYVKRLAINNPNATPANLFTADIYTPDSSVGDPSPVETIKLRYPVYITATDWIDIDGHTISKHMGSLAFACDTPNVVVGYVLELQ